ncbi:MAG: rhomboid family intramembrane serine protease, partial [Methylococcales bacterium]|nr:rhomboid family intramembrane serine protease [Methylococcales bacterium]
MLTQALQTKKRLFEGAVWLGNLFSRLPIVTLSLAGLSAALFFLFGPAAEGLVYQRETLIQGELFQLISAHFVHADAQHLIWNSLALLVLGGLLEVRQGAKTMLAYLAIGIVSVDIFILNQPSLEAYCGLSGLLNTLLVGV